MEDESIDTGSQAVDREPITLTRRGELSDRWIRSAMRRLRWWFNLHGGADFDHVVPVHDLVEFVCGPSVRLETEKLGVLANDEAHFRVALVPYDPLFRLIATASGHWYVRRERKDDRTHYPEKPESAARVGPTTTLLARFGRPALADASRAGRRGVVGAGGVDREGWQ